ncbi:MAG: hypothetical protein PHQ40_03620 [Anaerolineaceae bacterium]|nr:hypothetical protein [Anaerolineaceae bacterium]
MDSSLRNTLRLIITACRKLLEVDFRLQLEGQYAILAGMDPAGLAGGTISGSDRAQIAAALRHEIAQGQGFDQALERYIRESAFTSLNRLAALKLMEHPSRGLIQESIGCGITSKGFTQFALISPEAIRSLPDGGYRLYIELLFDDLACVLGVLFDRSLPTSTLFPSPTCLAQVLDQLNQPDLEPAWAQDETIGWIYQYFTPPEMRDEARKASSAPQNSNELAFRNQFYTPRYVVAFLAENTLGRMWYEMRQGDTRLAQEAGYLLHPPDVPIPARGKRDPRSLRILDPACGSGHFLLFCFDLLTIIYQEAYTDPDLGPGLRKEYPDPAAFAQTVPSLILENNLYGIDIDLRATQIASLALWLRSQRAWGEMGLSSYKRPRVQRVNVVCAEPMPGEYELLGEFLRDLQPVVLGKIVRAAWERMKSADEIGSLLKIEQEIRAEIHAAHRTLLEAPEPVQLLLSGDNLPIGKLGLSDETDGEFWDQAEERVLEALHRYAEQTAIDTGVLRRLFSHDALEGFAFVDLLMRPFDVVLMNPPFGAPSLGSREYISRAYPRTKNDLYAAFVERGLEFLRPGGMLGAITSRSGFFLKTFQVWREEILLKECTLVTLADLGYGVLDTAMVETAAYVLRKGG